MPITEPTTPRTHPRSLGPATRLVPGLVLLLASLACLLGCGGAAARGAATPEEETTPTGAAALARDVPSDVRFFADVEAMRRDARLAKVVSNAEGSAGSEAAEVLRRIDRVDLRGARHGEDAAWVAVLWGRFARDPRDLPAFAHDPQHALREAPALASGVREFVGSGGGTPVHLFVLSESVWVLAGGPPADSVRARLAADPSPPPTPRGALLHLVASAKVLGEDGPKKNSFLAGLDHADMTLTSNMDAFRWLLVFVDSDQAEHAEPKLKMVTAMLVAGAAAAAEDCKALGKLHVNVDRDGRNLVLELSGIGEAADAWDPETCPKIDGAKRGDDRDDRARHGGPPR